MTITDVHGNAFGVHFIGNELTPNIEICNWIERVKISFSIYRCHARRCFRWKSTSTSLYVSTMIMF